jgi:hypothetical protein
MVLLWEPREAKKFQGNQFLWYDKKVSDFKLTLKVKQVPFAANAGIQFRSMREPNGHAIGYQADIGKGWWGALYHEHGRKILAKNKDTAGKHLNPEKWNKYEILAVGHRIWLAINGKSPWHFGIQSENSRVKSLYRCMEGCHKRLFIEISLWKEIPRSKCLE